ncbi:hypothetical protein EUX98_g8064 [Antrodiella citrinella]|uniref:Uncharacterized protein n=1 Tax=Antrodiella citrinella TaxID=2447956 RepID=A0A4V3XGY0_9APHY|nr:hypothetical protein EUX98_g8064 [Antrodiella citrinella]
MSKPTKTELRTVLASYMGARGLPTCVRLILIMICVSSGGLRQSNALYSQDVDLIVMTNSHTTEVLKNMLELGGGGDFYTRASKKVGATYRILYCKIPSLYATRYNRSTKVDILIPGIMSIPLLSTTAIVRIDGLPALPFFALLMLKVQGWSDHRKSDRSDYRLKQYQDVNDIDELLVIGQQGGKKFLSEVGQLPKDFLDVGYRLLGEYVTARGGHASWEVLGFEFSS